jgi:hypothetical protein
MDLTNTRLAVWGNYDINCTPNADLTETDIWPHSLYTTNGNNTRKKCHAYLVLLHCNCSLTRCHLFPNFVCNGINTTTGPLCLGSPIKSIRHTICSNKLFWQLTAFLMSSSPLELQSKWFTLRSSNNEHVHITNTTLLTSALKMEAVCPTETSAT